MIELWIWIVGFIISISISIFTFWKSQENELFQSFVIFGITQLIVISLALRFIVLPRIEENLILAEEIKTDKNLFDVMVRFLAVQKDTRGRNNILEERLNRYLKEFNENVALAERGQFRVVRDDMGTFSIDLLKIANDSIIATSYVAPGEWWCTGWGKTYTQENYSAVKDRRVKVRRFFLFKSPEQLEQYKPLLNDQVKHGIKVFYILIEQLSSMFTHDVIVVDKKIGGKLAINPEQEMESATMYTAQSDIDEIYSTINNLQVRATEFKYDKNIRKPPCPD